MVITLQKKGLIKLKNLAELLKGEVISEDKYIKVSIDSKEVSIATPSDEKESINEDEVEI